VGVGRRDYQPGQFPPVPGEQPGHRSGPAW
jgi:hypothetical protein